MEMMGHIDRRAYNPTRDIARIWHRVFQIGVTHTLTHKGVGGKYLESLNLPEADLQAGLTSFVKVLEAIQSPSPDVKLQQVIEESELMKRDPRLLMALYSGIGATFLSTAYAATNDLLNHEDPPMSDKDFRKLLIETVGSVLGQEERPT